MKQSMRQRTFRPVRKVSLWEAQILLSIIMFVPLYLTMRRYLQVGQIWHQVNIFMITSITMGIIFLVLLLAYYMFRKPYIAITFGCHQKHCRSLKFFGRPFVLCARCTGILIGTWITPLIYQLPIHPLWFLLGIIPISLDGFIQYFTSYESTNFKRLITGMIFAPTFITILSYYHLLMAKIIMKVAFFIVNLIR